MLRKCIERRVSREMGKKKSDNYQWIDEICKIRAVEKNSNNIIAKRVKGRKDRHGKEEHERNLQKT